MLQVTITNERGTFTLEIPAKANKSIKICLAADYPQEDDYATLHKKANYYKTLCRRRKGKIADVKLLN